MSLDSKLLQSVFPSPDFTNMLRINHAVATREFRQPPENIFNIISSWSRYEQWSPDTQGPAHWLVMRAGGIGSTFILYDKPGVRHLAHFGEVTELERNRRFAWKAPFSEWQRAFIGMVVDLTPTSTGGTRVQSTIYFEARDDHIMILEGFLNTPGYDTTTFSHFLDAQLTGLARMLDARMFSAEEMTFPFDESQIIAADWSGRISQGEWVRILYADGELDFEGPPDVVFNAFTAFSRYADWTRMIHVGAEWLELKTGGVGSKFLLWEKPGDRQVMHYAVVTELERNRKFTWRAPFAEWGKVFIGTTMILESRSDGGTHAYHLLYADLPTEYLPIFGGFGSLHGFDLQFETFHIHEEARGFNRLLQSNAFTDQDKAFIFHDDKALAHDWPLQSGRRWPQETLTLKPDRVLTYEQMIVELSKIMAAVIPSPAFLQQYRNLAVTRHYNTQEHLHDHQ